MYERDFGKWVRRDLFGGSGEVAVQDLIGKQDVKPFEAVLACELETGGKVGAHHQETADELVICLAGDGRVLVGGAPAEFKPGAVAFVAKGTTMALENLSSSEALRYLIVKARAS
jgi:quercetin dioxygenase-like cupin family protein